MYFKINIIKFNFNVLKMQMYLQEVFQVSVLLCTYIENCTHILLYITLNSKCSTSEAEKNTIFMSTLSVCFLEVHWWLVWLQVCSSRLTFNILSFSIFLFTRVHHNVTCILCLLPWRRNLLLFVRWSVMQFKMHIVQWLWSESYINTLMT